MKIHNILKKGFSLAELGIALVILLIISTIATISYFSIIDNAKEVKIIEDTETLQLALTRVDIDIRDYSTEYNIGDLDQKIQDVLKYHLEKGTNLKGVVFPNKVLLDGDGYYVLGELKVKKSRLDNNNNISLLDILNVKEVKAEEITNGVNLEIRKLDNNKMNRLVQENLKGDWFIVSNSSKVKEDEEIKDKNVIFSKEPYNYNNGLLDDLNLISSIDEIPVEIFDNSLSTNYKIRPFFGKVIIDFKYPVNIKSMYVSDIDTYLTVSFYDEIGSRLNINDAIFPSYRLYGSNRNVELGYNNIEKENVHTVVIHAGHPDTSKNTIIREIDFFGSYIVEDIK